MPTAAAHTGSAANGKPALHVTEAATQSARQDHHGKLKIPDTPNGDFLRTPQRFDTGGQARYQHSETTSENSRLRSLFPPQPPSPPFPVQHNPPGERQATHCATLEETTNIVPCTKPKRRHCIGDLHLEHKHRNSTRMGNLLAFPQMPESQV